MLNNKLFYLGILFFSLPTVTTAMNWWQNSEQQGQTAFTQGHYNEAAQLFTDPYRRGVALYRDKKYAEAAEAFATVTRPEVKTNALYNLGNTYFQQGDYEKAIASYEQALATRPDFADARHNLELAKKQLNSSQQSSSQPDHSSENQKNEKSNENSKQNQSKQGSTTEQENQSSAEQNADSSPADSKSSSGNEEPSISEANAGLSPKSPEQEPSSQDMKNSMAQLAEKSPETQTDQKNSIEMSEASDQSTQSLSTEQNTPLNEQDKMVDTLLNRLQENPQLLLQRQFKIDAYHAKQENVPFPDKKW